MTKLTLSSRAAAHAAVLLGACLLAFASPDALAAGAPKGAAAASGAATGENTPLNLGGSSSAVPHASSGGASIVRTIVGLAIVIAVIWGLSWILRQVKTGRDPQVSTAGLASVAALTIGSGRSVHLIRAGNDYVLLGAGEHGLVPIHRYTEEQAREAGLPTLEETAPRQRRLPRSRAGAGPGAEPRPRRALLNPPREREKPRHDPMRMPDPSSFGVVERLREWTVRH